MELDPPCSNSVQQLSFNIGRPGFPPKPCPLFREQDLPSFPPALGILSAGASPQVATAGYLRNPVTARFPQALNSNQGGERHAASVLHLSGSRFLHIAIGWLVSTAIDRNAGGLTQDSFFSPSLSFKGNTCVIVIFSRALSSLQFRVARLQRGANWSRNWKLCGLGKCRRTRLHKPWSLQGSAARSTTR